MTESIIKESGLLETLVSSAAQSLQTQIKELTPLVENLLQIKDFREKITLLNALPRVKSFFQKRPSFEALVREFSSLEEYLLKALIVIQQGERCFVFADEQTSQHQEMILSLLSELKEVENFYDTLGGVVGYHLSSLRLLSELDHPKILEREERYFPPFGVDLTQNTSYVRKKIIAGIAAQATMAEIYPVGGAADRLNLQDEKTHVDLPAARLEFLGYTLLEWIIRDLQAREYLHFKLFHQQVITPIAFMTSHEKNNDRLVKEIVQEKDFFGRPQESFMFFSQPLVPTFTKTGGWCFQKPMKLLLKPGGHGVIWKLAAEKHILQWFTKAKKEKALVRQINNPLAGIDLGLIALIGVGDTEKKAFGFASCVRRVKTAEGMNLIKQRKTAEGFEILLSNIEYCDFKKFGIIDAPKNEHEPYSVFPANTNILFVNLPHILGALKTHAYPGMLVNFKQMEYYEPSQGKVVGEVARLELLMQNIADGFKEICARSLEEEAEPNLPTFITFNKRHKTISPTKKQFIPGAGLVETAWGCFYDYLKNARELLEEYCHFTIPLLPQEEEFLDQGPSFIFFYHPALGPLYTIIGQKIKKGFLALYAEVQLEIADLEIEQLEVEGSFLVQAKQVMGHLVEGKMCYSDQVGRCLLKNVVIRNKGIDRSKNNIYWKNTIHREERCCIVLEGHSEFIAENVTLEGDYTILVKDGERMIARQQAGEVVFHREPLAKDSLHTWNYHVNADDEIVLHPSIQD